MIIIPLEKGHRFGLDLVVVWCCFGVVLVSILSQFGLGLDLNWVILLWSCFGAGLEPIWFWFGFGFGLVLDWWEPAPSLLEFAVF